MKGRRFATIEEIKAASLEELMAKEKDDTELNTTNGKKDIGSSLGKPEDVYCYTCKEKGHISRNCTKRRKTMASVAAQATTCLAMVAAINELTDAVIAYVSPKNCRKLTITEPIVQVMSIRDRECKLQALLDAGSPISFIPTKHAATQSSPSKLLLGYDLRNHEDKKPKVFYSEGHFVVIRDSQLKPEESKKFKANYKGPYRTARVLNKNRYIVEDIPDFNITSKPYNSVLSPNRLKPWIKSIVSKVKF
ncbi:hypothetical protein ALC57_13295 [Trachymyrmex cornetzi]|uniref:CCHC-type domain-containing protein n=1 Tax=Trachymyrmex cornetzi TaxID=471704 RepID=A0A151IZK9_9HYME|nr:hypothetical protein ALC57_13295 [Trachymyrmex cornetzi]